MPNSFTVMARSATGMSDPATYIADLATVAANVDFGGVANKAQAGLTITKNSTGNTIAFLLPAATVLENVRVEFTDVP